jgi:hypothetical protein
MLGLDRRRRGERAETFGSDAGNAEKVKYNTRLPTMLGRMPN